MGTLSNVSRTALASLGALIVFAGAAGAQKKQERGWPLDMDGDVRIYNYNGSITVIGWERDSVALFAVIAGDREPFGGGGRRGVKAGIEGPAGGGAAPVADFAVYVPSRARVAIRAAATTVDVRGIAGTVDASTLGGRVHVSGPATTILVETMDGDVDVEASPASLVCKTATGRVTWSGTSPDVSVTTVAGTIVLPSAKLQNGSFESISGDIKFTGTVQSEGRVSFKSHSGDVTLAMPQKEPVKFTISAPRGAMYGREFAFGPGEFIVTKQVPGSGTAPPSVTASSFKGRVTVVQP